MSDPKEMAPERLAKLRLGLFHCEVESVFEHVDALTARAQTAERHLAEAREALGIEPGDSLAFRIGCARESAQHRLRERDEYRDRALAAEKKLAALVEATEELWRTRAVESGLSDEARTAWNTRTRESAPHDHRPLNDAREAVRTAAQKYDDALRAARGEP